VNAQGNIVGYNREWFMRGFVVLGVYEICKKYFLASPDNKEKVRQMLQKVFKDYDLNAQFISGWIGIGLLALASYINLVAPPCPLPLHP
jgi:hypothetical protein